MISYVSQLNQEDDMGEKWFLDAKQDNMELRNEINSIEEDSVDEATRQAIEANKPLVDAMKAKFEEDKTEWKTEFIQYCIDNFIEEGKR